MAVFKKTFTNLHTLQSLTIAITVSGFGLSKFIWKFSKFVVILTNNFHDSTIKPMLDNECDDYGDDHLQEGDVAPRINDFWDWRE